jgi:hypothetical protein
MDPKHTIVVLLMVSIKNLITFAKKFLITTSDIFAISSQNSLKKLP